jgi:hypothetical protein
MASKKMEPLNDEIARLEAEIARLQGERAGLIRAKELLTGEAAQPKQRRRAAPIKPLVLDIMRDAGPSGATSAEVDAEVRKTVPTVAKDTVGSVLSRLKSDGALVYVGERYYEKGQEPKPTVVSGGWATAK